jgi:integrase
MSKTKRSPARQGIEQRTDSKGAPRYRGTAYDELARRHLRGPWTPNLAQARSWRVDALARIQNGTLSAAKGPTVREAAEQFLEGIKSGAIRNRSGRRYKPSVLTGYEYHLRSRVLPALGAARLVRVTRAEVQVWADSLNGEGLAPNTIRNTVTPLQALYAWAIPRGLAHVNPCASLRLPSGEQARDRVATAAEAAKLIATLPAKDQAALGLAVYAGLRMGELLALEWHVIDLEARTLRVTRAWDEKSKQFLSAKTKAGQDRKVPIVDRLAVLLADHAVLMDHPSTGLLFPGAWDSTRPLSGGGLRNRAAQVWERTGLRPLGFHEGRHTFASLMIAAGVNAKALSTYMGHANIKITLDRYGHLMPGNEAEARALLDAYLEREGG